MVRDTTTHWQVNFQGDGIHPEYGGGSAITGSRVQEARLEGQK